MKVKVFRTIDEQILILQNKGMIIDDIDFAKDILIRENYFFLSGYRFLFFKSNVNRQFLPNTNFKELYAVFNFDRQIRNIIFKNLLIIENNIKSIITSYKEFSYSFA